jgi:sulfatase modifying factor 1
MRKNTLFLYIGMFVFLFCALSCGGHNDKMKFDTITGKDGAPMARIPAGEFVMGAQEGRGENDEFPRHKVYVDEFYMDQYEVTVSRYKKFCEATERKMPEQMQQSGDDFPVINVTWFDAAAYAAFYGERLPTEAEWEKACRAGTDMDFYFGDLLDKDEANFNSKGPVKVGSYQPNAYGLYDMHGNVYEWCNDWFSDSYYQSSPYKNPKGPETGKNKVMRGGGWNNFYPSNCRSANREWFLPETAHKITGFRCVISKPVKDK